MSQCLITIAFPIYNNAKFVAEAIESVLIQGIEDIEILVIDDASTDNTVAVVEELAARDVRIRLIRNSRSCGPSGALAKYVKEMRGEYIAILSSDDVFAPGKLAAQLDYMKQYPNAAMVATGLAFIDELGNTIKNSHHFGARLFDTKARDRGQWLRYFFNHGNNICAPSVMLRADLVQALAIPEPRMMHLHDYDCWVQLVIAGYDIGVIDASLIRYRIRDNNANLSFTTPATRARCLFEHIEVLNRYHALTRLGDLILMLPDESHVIPENVDEEAYVQHRISLHAWVLATPQHRMFALHNWYRLLGKKEWINGLETLGVNAHFLAEKSAHYPLAEALAMTPERILRRQIEHLLPPALYNKLVRWIKKRRDI